MPHSQSNSDVLELLVVQIPAQLSHVCEISRALSVEPRLHVPLQG